MEHGSLPDGLILARTTAEFDVETVPPGLLRTHRVAAGIHGRIRVLAGAVRFVWEDDGERADPVELGAGDSLVIPPEVPHHVEPDADARFVIDFHRPPVETAP